MKILSIDTCGDSCGVCLWDGRIASAKAESMPRGQDARIMPMIREVMGTEALEGLDKIVVTKGPGSFTGTRIGIAVALGMGFGLGKPVLGVDRFEAYYRLHSKSESEDLIIVLDSMREELFCCIYKKGMDRKIQMLRKEAIELLIDNNKEATITGDVNIGSAKYKEYNPKDVLEMIAIIASQADIKDDRYRPVPLYVREPDVSVPKNKGARA